MQKTTKKDTRGQPKTKKEKPQVSKQTIQIHYALGLSHSICIEHRKNAEDADYLM